MKVGTASTSSYLIGLGIGCQLIAFALTEMDIPALSIFVAILGTISFFAGLSEYAYGKGYSRLFALLGLLSFLGLFILALLADKHPAPQKQR